MPTLYPREKWDAHLARLNWRQGEHLMICAPTGSGKTTVAKTLLLKRGWVLGFFNKALDETAKDFGPEWERLKDWPRFGIDTRQNRLMLWPATKANVSETIAHHSDVFRRAVDAVHVQGHRTLFFDETHYLTGMCGLGREIEYFHYFGRSNNITCVTNMQRPRWVPKIIMSSVTHAYIGRTFDKDDLRHLSNLGGVDATELAYNVSKLPNRYSFVYVNPQGDGQPSIVNTRW